MMKTNKEQKNKRKQVKAVNNFKQMRKYARENGFMSNDEINKEIELTRKKEVNKCDWIKQSTSLNSCKTNLQLKLFVY